LKDDVDFNYSIIVDIFYIDGKPVLHIVDEGTRYQAGGWLRDISAKHTWDTIKYRWIDTYLGPPDKLTADAGKQFASKEFSQLASALGVKVKIVPIEAHHSVGAVERYHGMIRRAYAIIIAEIPGLNKDIAL
jgi:IS30 family transposase